jgi:unsaturated rhamnogalacturonyl hydrolase
MKVLLKLFGLLVIVLINSFVKVNAQTWSEKMATTVMTVWKDSLFTDLSKPAKWTYDQGVILKGIEDLWYRTGDVKYFNYMQQCMDFFVNERGEIRTYKLTDYNLDNLLCGRVLLTLAKVTNKEKYFKAATTLWEQLKSQPRTNEGGFWHKKIYPYQMWLDGLYMAEPFYVEYAVTVQDTTVFDDIALQFIRMENHARDPKTGLLFHGWDESKAQKWANPVTGTSPHFWARAMAWYGMALVDVLEKFPVSNKYHDSLQLILQRFVKAIKNVQDPKTGLWYDILNMPGAKGNYFEASASSMFVCAIAKAVRLGLIPDGNIKTAKLGYEGIITTFLEKDGAGQTNLKGTVSVSGLGGNPYRDGSYDYYMSEKVVLNDPKGVGAFLQAANEMELVQTLSVGKGNTVLLDDYFNAERKKDFTGKVKPFHYKWDEFDNSGFSLFGSVFQKYGVNTKTLSEKPTLKNLKNTSIYLIVDADNLADNPSPNYIQDNDAEVIYQWVNAGGILVLMHNDKGNADFEHFNILSDRFGIHFNEDSYNKVVGNEFEGGMINIQAGNPILPTTKKIYQKEICSFTLKAPALSMLKKENLVIFAVAKIGKGTVFATGDPWLYNEYVDGRRIPPVYENFKAANELVNWLIKQVPKVTTIKK